ncbi:MAG: tRNA-dihydrouridine synthase family protein [Proteobacteria bacterium]|nr:tRNA-dihydrouridine synthase family protein [Pseudomonadota bacterium]MBU4385172.1 tRNA-dihydrouridine synthase family protein [Pseudomonadota bacterium]MBU4603423.1 tRNA-dihydrouridine synthase family protein [Pseudomonadota bacterium]MCG2764779.1 tRNA-dihydrouridine synthase family protein [Desulfarculaceae bacterium]
MQLLGLTLQSPFVAAPMAGVSGPAFRLMARRAGAAMVYSEMVSAAGLLRHQPQTLRLTRSLPGERPLVLQLFGASPRQMGEAAAIACTLGVDALDVNMGCPAKKVRRPGAGSALLEDPILAAEIMAAVAEASSLPVSAKIRLGPKSDITEELVPRLVKAGAQVITLHARTTRQGFGGRADWEAIKRLASWCPVPVIGNGDVTSGRAAVRMLEETGCAAVMIGRGAMGDPWIFSRAVARLAGQEPQPVTPAMKRRALAEHLELAKNLGGEGHAIHFIRQFMMWYSRGLPGASLFRRQAGACHELAPLWELCDQFFLEPEQMEPEQPEQAA